MQIFLLCTLPVFCQTTFSGKIVDDLGKPISEAYIMNKTEKTFCYSNENGKFKLEDTKIGDLVEVGALGFKKELIPVTKEVSNDDLIIVMSEDAYQLKEVIVRPTLSILNEVVDVDLAITPVKSSQEILRKVPGLFIGQHAGGGKAEQMFLRGFDLDHGTDISINVDGMPVNMVSHAHGQGYADLHFLIPESIKSVDFGKGPYYAEKGNFNTAGYVDFETKTILNKNVAEIQLGSFGLKRGLGMINVLNTNKDKAYLASEIITSEGYFESPQDFERINLFGKYNHLFSTGSRLTVAANHFQSTWNASGQIPERAIISGLIGRFGSIDDTEGGTTSRTSINLGFSKAFENDIALKMAAFTSNYQFQLFSNFTFFLNDPDNGDQIKQKENRFVSGLNLNLSKTFDLENKLLTITTGTGLRNDRIKDNELSRTLNRNTTVQNVQLGNVTERNTYAFLSGKLKWNRWLFDLGLRLDAFTFEYSDFLQNSFTREKTGDMLFTPKINMAYTPNNKVQFYLKSGVGFHSNDTRVILQNTEQKLPKSYGADIGTIWKPTEEVLFNVALWTLHSDQEFVYVGDEGIVEPNGKSVRYGVDLGIRSQINEHVFLFADATYSHARSLEAKDGMDHIPLAPGFTLSGGLQLSKMKNFSGGLTYRYLGNRPANEDFSITADGYFVTDMSLNYAVNNNISLTFGIENMFNTKWKEAQFVTNSRLAGEEIAVEEIHFTPGTPFSVRTGLRYVF
ncbi:TonB-dependent receptor domain-containing protein [Flagellimonas sp. CMM7]|uniref:TonB-dependent receptor n=1 Tax=Flagellimonas sp. CMM7 TaxID=2654676 RepID=UPI0013D5DA51|nr:TonB-dependent receptor [Flagellimonas sp. CMM7]UII79081.1 TonB-dependent receptor [Flagellimonas sp. CMM7]